MEAAGRVGHMIEGFDLSWVLLLTIYGIMFFGPRGFFRKRGSGWRPPPQKPPWVTAKSLQGGCVCELVALRNRLTE